MSLKSFLLNLFFPVECLGCLAPGAWLCEKCFRSLKFTNRKYSLSTPDLDALFIAACYDDPLLSELLKKFKFQPCPELGPILGRLLIMFWPGASFGRPEFASATDSPILVAPVPLSDKRRRWRGFNQAEILAIPFAAHFHYRLSRDLKRIRHRRPQTELSEPERTVNVRDAFLWTGSSLSGRTLILIDDIATTGATLNECARILKEAGAAKVYGLALAKG